VSPPQGARKSPTTPTLREICRKAAFGNSLSPSASQQRQPRTAHVGDGRPAVRASEKLGFHPPRLGGLSRDLLMRLETAALRSSSSSLPAGVRFQSPIGNRRWHFISPAATGSGSARKPFPSADSYTSRSSDTEADTTTRPPALIFHSFGNGLSEQVQRGAHNFGRTCLIPGSWLGSQDTTTRLASSPTAQIPPGSRLEAKSTRKPIPFANVGSAADGQPAREQSCAAPPAPPGSSQTSPFWQRGFLLEVQFGG